MGYSLNSMPHRNRHEQENGARPDSTPPMLPAPSCVTLEEVGQQLYIVQAQNRDILIAIKGNKPMGHTGIAERVDNLEDNHEVLKTAHEENGRKNFRFMTVFSISWVLLCAAYTVGKDFFVAYFNSPHKP